MTEKKPGKPKREYTPEEQRRQRLWSQAQRRAQRMLAARYPQEFKELRAKILRELEEEAATPPPGQ